jgi:(p)ppGpp synthase/HD superfamily hydrolase
MLEITTLTERFERALVFAHRLHGQQRRKGSDIPYISHLMSVSALVLEMGGNESEAIAGLLHDAIEDQGGEATRQAICEQFGPEVADIVQGCTDCDTHPKPPWLERKRRYLRQLQMAPVSVRRVALADKLHNARSTLFDLERWGPEVWQKFQGGREGSIWYYNSLVKIFDETRETVWSQEFKRIVSALNTYGISA